jgi:hypothetical protein
VLPHQFCGHKSILVWISGCWYSSNILLTCRPPKNTVVVNFLAFFGDRLDGRDGALRYTILYNPSAEEAGGLDVFSIKQLRTLNFFQDLSNGTTLMQI